MIDLVKATLKDVVQALEGGAVTSAALVRAYRERIEEHNIRGLGLRAVLELAPTEKLTKVAEKLDKERADGVLRSPLHGVPVLLKDAINTATSMGMETTGGTNALLGSTIKNNAEIVDKLLEAGVIVLGKANMTVMNNFYGGSIPNGWSPRGGQTGSAYGTNGFDPSGSSTGSAVATSAGMCAAAVGVETCGSIICPARQAGLYGMKPTLGLVSNAGIMPITPRYDSAGPMGKSVWDMAALLGCLTGQPGTYEKSIAGDYTDLAQYRLGVPRVFFPADEDRRGGLNSSEETKLEAVEIFDEIVKKLTPAIALDPADIENAHDIWSKLYGGKTAGCKPRTSIPSSWGRIMNNEFFGAMNAYLADRGTAEVYDVASLVAWNAANPSKAYHGAHYEHQDDKVQEALRIGGQSTAAYKSTLAHSADVACALQQLFDSHNLDALLLPGGLGPGGVRAQVLATMASLPIITLPVAVMKSDEPYGIILIGRKGDDAKLLGIAAACEKVVGIHPLPTQLV